MVALKTLIFTILVPGTVAGIVPWLLLQSSGGANLTLSLWLIGLLPLLLGVGLYFWCAGAFTFIGKGTPAPIDAPIFLVREGPYQWVRNPIRNGVDGDVVHVEPDCAGTSIPIIPTNTMGGNQYSSLVHRLIWSESH